MTYDTLGKTVPHREQFFFLGEFGRNFLHKQGKYGCFCAGKKV